MGTVQLFVALAGLTIFGSVFAVCLVALVAERQRLRREREGRK